MTVKKTDKIWHNGAFKSWDDAQLHVVSHVVSYGSSVFEGIRCYHTTEGPAIFRLRDHMQRLRNSAHVYRMDPEFSLDELCDAATDLIRLNRMDSCYIRPMILRGYGDVGVNPFNCPIESYMACWEWNNPYLGEEAVHAGVDVCVSSWARSAPNTLPQMAKCAANYMNSQLIRMEAMLNGYVEGIALDVSGHVSEGSGENIFLVMDGAVITPPLENCVLPGITRHSVLTMCRDLDIPAVEQVVPREMLYLAEEVFFCGTAAEITPIRSIDKIRVGKGGRGTITRRIQDEFFGITSGTKSDTHGWLTHIRVDGGVPIDERVKVMSGKPANVPAGVPVGADIR
jgi:branched-chain amino acid aminotransferase